MACPGTDPNATDARIALASARGRRLLVRLYARRLVAQRPQLATARRAGAVAGPRADGRWRPVSRLMRRLAPPAGGRARVHLHQFVLQLRQSLHQSVLRRAPAAQPAPPTVIRIATPAPRQRAAPRARPPGMRGTQGPGAPARATDMQAAPMQVLQPPRPHQGTDRAQPRRPVRPSPAAAYRPLPLTLARATAPAPAPAEPVRAAPATDDLAFVSGIPARHAHMEPMAAPDTGLPARELQRVTAHVLAQLERRARSWRERTQQA